MQTNKNTQTSKTDRSAEKIKSFLSFKLDTELFAIPVMDVIEIVEVPPITKIPQSPEFLKGVINLRGAVLPIIDARVKFGFPSTEPTVNTCIIVLEVEINEEAIYVGALVDAVLGVFEMDENAISPSPTIGAKYKANFIKGMIKNDDNFIMLLDIDKVFSALEVDIVLEVSE